MLALLSAGRDQAPRLSSALPVGRRVLPVADWEHLERVAPTVECSVVQISRLHDSPALPRLSAFKARHPDLPTVLVTRWEPENARCLKDLFVEEVVWDHEVGCELVPAVQRVCGHRANYVRCLVVPFETAGHLPRALRDALAFACRSDRAVHSVKQLAAATGAKRGTLWHQWKRVAGEDSALRLQDLLHWILLLRVAVLKSPDRSWAAVAEEVGVHGHTLSRYAKQLTGCTLRELEAREDAVTLLFRERVLGCLLDGELLDLPRRPPAVRDRAEP
ncbi:MAG TPA: hypothetical protein VF615_30070 [Longimicrobiaceae bacterium]